LMDEVIVRALEKKPEDRFASAADFALAMKAVLEGRAVLPKELQRADELPDTTLAMPNAPGQKPAERPRQALATPQPPARPSDNRLGSPMPAAAARDTQRPAKAQSLGILVAVAALCLVVGAGAMIALMKLAGH
jgi:eukaryotic-like serine/threonine-protein kinase